MTQALRITLAAADEDLAVACLWDAGTSGVEVKPGAAGSAVLLAYFEAAPPEDLAERLIATCGARVEQSAVPEVDWLARFREGFTRFESGNFLIAPPWDPGELRPGQKRLVVDPGRAFGTGTHESTQLCLAALEAIASERPLGRVLDLGTGAGILAVAAALLGARSVTGVDFDPEAVAVARAHARLNGVAIELLQGDGARPFRRRAFDCVLANVQASFLIERAPEILGVCGKGGVVVLSGILREQVEAIVSAYGSAPRRLLEQGEWAALMIDGGGQA